MRSRVRGPLVGRVLLLIGSLVVALLLVELLLPLGFRIVKGYAFPRARTQAQLLAQAALTEEGRRTSEALTENEYVPHPYLGFALNLDLRRHESDAVLSGFRLPWMQRSPDRLVVALAGGSFASQIGTLAGAELVHGIERASHKKVHLVNLALGGYKQPQQLLSLVYLLSLGAEFDLVINVDGFNEVALPPTELVPRGIFPFYPRDWYVRMSDLDATARKQRADLQSLLSLRTRWARIFQSSPLHLSNTALALWRSVDLRLNDRITQLTLRFGRRDKTLPWKVSGPVLDFDDDSALLDSLADDWARCSLQLDRLCRANKAHYLHCLQPNQYVPGTKPMSPDERTIAITADGPYGPWARKGYPYLNRYGQNLIEQGVDFHDLTMLFRDVERPLYADSCCHLNKEGYRLVAGKIVEILSREGYFRGMDASEGEAAGSR